MVARYRRQGLAEEAAGALLRWATAHGAVGIKASVRPSNSASIGLMRKLGFTVTGRYERHAGQAGDPSSQAQVVDPLGNDDLGDCAAVSRATRS